VNKYLYYVGVGGIMVSIAAFQAVNAGSIPGHRIFELFFEKKESLAKQFYILF
jgi:hypothetical protein